ncbi:MAG: hypothetical protein JXB39_15460 [Deltaproteobacteria bacterium]|nr:hypothetical protein [Deltaproteobacteria bacterium]
MATGAARRLVLPTILVLIHAGVLGVARWLAATVVPAWKKGPLIDPAAPYAPEHAIWLFAVAMLVVLDVYLALLALAAWRRWRRAWIPWVAMGLALLAAEGGIRLWLDTHSVTYFRPHPVLHWVVRPHLSDFPNVTGGGTITTNRDGMRDVTVPRRKDADEFRILLLGDSSAFGQGVAADEGMSAVLERLLQGRVPGRRVEVLNGACPGWTTFQAVRFLEGTGLAYGPDIVVAGFNNDSGPDYFGDAARAPVGASRAIQGLLFRSEVYLLGREMVLSTARRLFPAPATPYTARTAGRAPTYGKLDEDEARGLVPRVDLEAFDANLRALHRLSGAAEAAFAWIDMPVNRLLPELVDRYVDPAYRARAAEVARSEGALLVPADRRWSLTREWGLHQVGHVFHPTARGHQRLAEQVAADLLTAGLLPGASGTVAVGGPPPASGPDTVRFGWSTRTPVHAHVGLVLESHPEIATRHGLALDLARYASGGPQGEDVAAGRLDAFFTCGVPAVQMLAARPDASIVASPGALGRIAVVARRDRAATLADLAGRRVGLAPRSTPALDWEAWGAGLGATEVPLDTDALLPALLRGEVDAIAGWDPWVETWLREGGSRLVVVAERSFASDLAVGVVWAAQRPGQARALVEVVAEALGVAASDRPRWDAAVADLSGWPIRVVRAVADRNEILSGRAPANPGSLAIPSSEQDALAAAIRFAGPPGLDPSCLFGPEILEGQLPGVREAPAVPQGPPPRPTRPGGPVRPRPPRRGPG